jgi:hypothetical protein
MASVHNRDTIPLYSRENPIAGATTAYSGRKSMVKIKEPGIAGSNSLTELRGKSRIHHTSNGVLGPNADETDK